MKDIKPHLIIGQYFYTDQYRYNEDNGEFFVINGRLSVIKTIALIAISSFLFWVVLPDKLDKDSYVAFNEILFTYFCFMCLLLASYFAQKHHVHTYNGLEEIDRTLAEINISFVNPSSTFTNHLMIILSYLFLVVSVFINMYCASHCEARPSTVFKLALMSELIYKNSILASVIRMIRDRYKSLNGILKIAGKKRKNCPLCQQRLTSREEVMRTFQSCTLEEYCVSHLLK